MSARWVCRRCQRGGCGIQPLLSWHSGHREVHRGMQALPFGYVCWRADLNVPHRRCRGAVRREGRPMPGQHFLWCLLLDWMKGSGDSGSSLPFYDRIFLHLHFLWFWWPSWANGDAPNKNGGLSAATSARWSALVFPGMSICDGVWSHFSSSPNASVVVKWLPRDPCALWDPARCTTHGGTTVRPSPSPH